MGKLDKLLLDGGEESHGKPKSWGLRRPGGAEGDPASAVDQGGGEGGAKQRQGKGEPGPQGAGALGGRGGRRRRETGHAKSSSSWVYAARGQARRGTYSYYNQIGRLRVRKRTNFHDLRSAGFSLRATAG